MMELKDFRAVKLFDYYGKAQIWGEQVGVGIDCDIHTLEAMIPVINSLIDFLNGNKTNIISALAQKGYLEDAENYATTTDGVEPVPYETNTWLMPNGAKVRFPLTDDDFAGYLYIESIAITHAVPPSDIKANVYLITRPDLFDEHCINLIVDNREISICGLEDKDYKGYSFEDEADLTRNFNAIYHRHVTKGFGFIKFPDPDEHPLSHWTYSDMKREYELSVELFKEKGYSDEECCDTAYRCVTMSAFHSRKTLTEQVMARTVDAVYRIEHGLLRNTKWYKDVYIDQLVKEYHKTPAKGFTQPEQDKAEFERDIDYIIRQLEVLPFEGPVSQSRYDTAKAVKNIEYKGLNLNYSTFEKMYTEKDPDPEPRKQKLRELLSPAAYELITEYDFGKLNIEMYEHYVLEPLELQMTEPLRRFLELYDRTVFAYHTHRFNSIDCKYSCQNYDGHYVDAVDYAAIGKDGKYYIRAMHIHYAGDCIIYVGSDGKIYEDFACGLFPIADSMKEFLEQHAYQKALADVFLARRIELDNKYLIPEIRVSSM